jgi:hypothetical protein
MGNGSCSENIISKSFIAKKTFRGYGFVLFRGMHCEIARRVKNVCFARGPILTAAHAFRGGGVPKSPYTCSKARRQDIPSARYPWITFGIEAHAQYKRRSAASTVQGVGVWSGRFPARLRTFFFQS